MPAEKLLNLIYRCMQVLVGLICLVPALGLQQAVSYQNFRASHGQGHPTYRSDGSWSQSFGGGHRSFGGGLRGLGKELPVIRANNHYPGSGHQNFAPSQSSFGPVQNSYSPGPAPTVSLQSSPQYTEPGSSFGPTAAPSQASSFESHNYNSPSPPGNPLINNGPGPAYSDSPLPSFTPESLPPPQNFGNDRLPHYASNSAPQNYNGNGPIYNTNLEPTNTQYSGGPQYLENRGPEFRSEASPQPTFQQSGPTTLGPLGIPNLDGRSLSYQESPSYVIDTSYQTYDAPKRDFAPIQNQGPGQNQLISKDYNGVSYNTNGKIPNSNYGHNGRAPTLNNISPGRSYSADFTSNDRPPHSDYSPNGRGPNSDFRSSSGPISSSYSSNERGPTSDFGSNGRGPTSNFGQNGRGPSSNFRPTNGGPSPNFGNNDRRLHSEFSSHLGGSNSESGPNDRGLKPTYEPNGKTQNSKFGSNARRPDSDYSRERGSNSDFSNERRPNSDIKQQGRLPFSDFRPNGRGGVNSDFPSNGKGPNSDFKAGGKGLVSDFGSNTRTSSFTNEPSRPDFSASRNPSLNSGAPRKPYGRPHHSPLEDTGPQTFLQHKASLGPKKPLVPNNSQGLRPSDDRKSIGVIPAKFDNDKLKEFRKDRHKPNFSAEEGEQSFESDFKSTELGGQSFEPDIPDFASDESYFNSQEAYGSFESGGKTNFGSGEAKDSLEINNSPNFESGEKGFSDRDASVESQERSGSAESNGREESTSDRIRSGPPFRDAPPAGRSRISEEKKLDLPEKKLISSSGGNKKSFTKSDDSEEKSFTGSETRSSPTPRPGEKKTSSPIKDSQLPYTTDLSLRKPFPSPPSKLFPEKKASFAIEKFVPFDKPYALLAPSKRMPYAVESRIPYEVKVPFNKAFRGELRRIFKRQPSEEKIEPSESKSSIAGMNVPGKTKKID